MFQTKRDIYEELTALLTHFEHSEDYEGYDNVDWEAEMYEMLVKIQNRWEDTITAYEEESKMSRVDNIAKFAQKKEMEKIAKEKAITQQFEDYKAQIRAFKPRIDELLVVGNACLEHGIPLETQSSDQSYKTHQFVSNGWSHLNGFIKEYDQNTRQPLPFTKVGKIGGGWDDYTLKTDGVHIQISGSDALFALKRFVEGFDEFETEFYKYVDKVTGVSTEDK